MMDADKDYSVVLKMIARDDLIYLLKRLGVKYEIKAKD